MEEDNKHWLSEEKRVCVFYEKGNDNWEHYIGECEVAKEWFDGLGKNRMEKEKGLWNEELDVKTRYIIRKFWKEAVREKKKRQERIERNTR